MTTERKPLPTVEGLARTATLPPPPRRPSGMSDDATSSDIQTEATRPRAVAPSRKPGAPRSRRGESPGFRPVTLSLPVSLVSQVKARARQEQTSQPDVLMDAVAATVDRLDVLLDASHSSSESDGLFIRHQATRPVEPMSTLTVRLLSTNLATIDELAAKHEAPSRSALCAVALRDYLVTMPNSE